VVAFPLHAWISDPVAVVRPAGRCGYAIFIPEIARLITNRWISDVPSKIV
jgi:hypothetical protein